MVAPLHVCAVPVTFDTGVVGERIGTVLRPVTLTHPQDMVSNSLDKIVDVKERLNEAEGWFPGDLACVTTFMPHRFIVSFILFQRNFT